jgi:hypothetical protein
MRALLPTRSSSDSSHLDTSGLFTGHTPSSTLTPPAAAAGPGLGLSLGRRPSGAEVAGGSILAGAGDVAKQQPAGGGSSSGGVGLGGTTGVSGVLGVGQGLLSEDDMLL